MRLIKPEWVNHDGNPIFSIDIHPDGTKFATGGQGTDAGQVVIWSLMPIIDENADASETITKKLCQLDNHLACVNSVRWSSSGSTLASGGDDKIIMLWNRGKGPSAIFGNTGITQCVENWRTTATLRGHSGDILDIAWSPQDKWLASSSVDNNIIVWDIQNAPNVTMTAILKGHSGLVKGVTWDPVGKFIASQSDDRTLKIWRTSDFTCEATIKEPFEECGGTTHVLRLSWSPDGLYLVSAHAMNSGGPTAQIIEREGWKCDKDFVGHRKAVTCVRFHPSILKKQEPAKKYCCLAIGSRDKSLSVWLTAHQRPLCVIYELFNDSILDLSWSERRNMLAACSTDGSVAFLSFSEEELGTSLSQEDKNSLYQRMYGKSANVNLNESSVDKGLIIEYPELMDVGDNSSAANIESPIETISTTSILSTITNVNTNTATSTTTITTTNNTNSTVDISAISNTTITNTTTNATVTATTTTNDTSPVATNQPPPDAISSSNQSTLLETPTKAIHKQIESRRADGKRRITPMFIPMNDQENEPAPEPPSIRVSTPIASSAFVKRMNEQMTKGEVVFDSGASSATSTPKLTSTSMPESVVASQTHAVTVQTQPKVNNAQLDVRLTIVPPVKTTGVQDAMEVVSAEPTIDAATLNTMVRRSVFIAKATPYTAPASKKCDGIEVEVHNGSVHTQAGQLCKVSGISVLNKWEMFIGSPVVSFGVCAKYVVVCCLDCSVRFMDIRNGTPVLPALHMPKPAIQSIFSINSELGAVITECGSIRVWNLTTKTLFTSISCSDLFVNAVPSAKLYVTFFHVSEGGILYIMLSNGCAYSYNKSLESWITLNSRDPVVRLGISTLPNNSKRNLKSFPLGLIQSASQNLQPSIRNLQDLSNISWQNPARLSFIENQIKICESIQSPNELEFWYEMLGTQLVQHGTESRLRTHLDDLLGLPNVFFSSDAQNGESNEILGIDKHKMLRQMLDQLKTVARWQRIYVEYNEQLRNFSS